MAASSRTAAGVKKAFEGFKSEAVTTAAEAIEQDAALHGFIASTLDAYRDEYFPLAFALFCHSYLDLVHNKQEPARFLKARGAHHVKYHHDDMVELGKVLDATSLETARKDPQSWIHRIYEQRFQVTLSQFAAEALQAHLFDHQHSHLLSLIARHVALEVTEATPSFFRPSSLTKRLMLETKAGSAIATGKSSADVAALQDTSVEWQVPAAFRNPFLPSKEDDDHDEDAPDANSPYALKLRGFFTSAHDAVPDSETALVPQQWPAVALLSFLNTSDGLTSVSSSPALVAAGFEDSTVRVYQAVEGELVGRTSTTLIGHKGPVHGVSLWPGRPTIVSCSDDGDCRLWTKDNDAWCDVACFHGSRPVWDVAFAPCGYLFASGGKDTACRLWACDQPAQCVRVFAGHFADVACVAWHPNAHYVATGSDDKTCRVFDVRTGGDCRLFVGHLGSVESLAFDPSGRLLATGGRDGTVMVWDFAAGKRVATLRTEHEAAVSALAWTPDGRFLASGGADCAVKLYSRDALDDVGKSFATKRTPLVYLHAPNPQAFVAAGSFS